MLKVLDPLYTRLQRVFFCKVTERVIVAPRIESCVRDVTLFLHKDDGKGGYIGGEVDADQRIDGTQAGILCGLCAGRWAGGTCFLTYTRIK